jgi:hypothetical protein
MVGEIVCAGSPAVTSPDLARLMERVRLELSESAGNSRSAGSAVGRAVVELGCGRLDMRGGPVQLRDIGIQPLFPELHPLKC